MLKLEKVLVAASLFLSLLPFAGYQSGRERWAMLTDAPVVATASAVVGIVMWTVYFTMKRRTAKRCATSSL